ncbi:hypothetical protein HF086_012538 [Spodoptera exigua]|uniref:RING-type domain-containing protein n=1 Tax=Spodoptera exigua TaxID=7107 RepID=A0A922SS27_SPOEX|nr:hypothetical protein HF086_012538 [Spodoptera exigua]
MDTSENKKNKKKRKASRSLSKTSSEQKENVPKNKDRVIKSEPDDGIAKSKLLLQKKSKPRARRSKQERIHLNVLDLEPIDSRPPPIIPPKKRKKPEVPYIVGCKDRPQVPSRASTKFCKGDSDYGISSSGADPEDEEPKQKRAKKSRIKNYSKSTFNALSDEISKKLTENESGNVSDCSSDSNKTIEYDFTPYQPPKPRPFSPIPSTSRDRETFIKNDERFNESLKGIEAMEQCSPHKEKATEHEQEQKPMHNVKLEETTATEQSSQNENEVEIIDVPYDTIEIDDYSDSFSQKTIINEVEEIDLIQIMEPQGNKVPPNPKQTTSNLTNDEDCIVITNETINEDSRETIIIEDEYSSINEFTLNNEKYDSCIDVDEIINENKSILEKWKNKTKEFNKITTVIEVPDDSSNTRMPTSTTITNPTNNNPSNSQIDQNDSIVLVDCPSPQTVLDRSQQNRQNQQTLSEQVDVIEEVPLPQSQDSVFKNILDDFFKHQARNSTNVRPVNTKHLERLLESFFNSVPSANNSSQISTVNSQTATNNLQIEENRQRPPPEVSRPPPQTTSTPRPPSPEPKRSLGDCPICLDSLASNGIASTLCGHVFCVNCIKTAIRQNGKKCPTCRKALKGPNGGYHLLYL